MKKSTILALSVFTFIVGCNSSSNIQQESKKFNQLPQVVQQVVRARAANAEVTDIDKKQRDGQTTYVIQFRDSNKYPEMEVAADGRLIKYEAGTAALGAPGPVGGIQQGGSTMTVDPNLSALPIGVQKAVVANMPRADVKEIRRHEQNGKITYEIEYYGNEPRKVIYVNPLGEVVKRGTENSD